MRATLAFTIKEFQVLVRDPGGLFVLFLMPVMFMVVFSLALGGLFEEGAARGSARALEVPVAIGGAGEVAEQVVEQLEATQGLAMVREQNGQPLTAEKVAQLVADGEYPVGVVFPEGLTALLEDPRILRGEQVQPLEVDVIVDPATTAQVTGPLEGALSAVLQQVVGRRLGEAGAALWFEQVAVGLPAEVREQLAASMQQGGQGGGASPVTTRRQVPPGVEREQFPDQFQQNAAAYTVMGVFFIATVMIESIFVERRSGAMRRLRAAPVGRAPILISKLVPFYVVNLIQIVIMFAIARLAFGLDLGLCAGAGCGVGGAGAGGHGAGNRAGGRGSLGNTGDGAGGDRGADDVGAGRGDGAALHHARGHATDRKHYAAGLGHPGLPGRAGAGSGLGRRVAGSRRAADLCRGVYGAWDLAVPLRLSAAGEEILASRAAARSYAKSPHYQKLTMTMPARAAVTPSQTIGPWRSRQTMTPAAVVRSTEAEVWIGKAMVPGMSSSAATRSASWMTLQRPMAAPVASAPGVDRLWRSGGV